jgi:hypothetical protein
MASIPQSFYVIFPKMINSIMTKLKQYPEIERRCIQGAWYFAKAVTIGQTAFAKAITASRIDQIIFSQLERVIYTKNGEISNIYMCDMILYEYRTFKDNRIVTHVKRFDKVSEFEAYDKETTCECYANFLGVQIKLINSGDELVETYDISLGNKNYYIKGNVLFDISFVKYLMHSQHGVTLSKQKYVVSFFDSSLDHITIDETEHIEIIDKEKFYCINKTI